MKLFQRRYWCWLLRHKAGYVPACRTENDLFNMPTYKRCKHCGYNLGEDA